MNIRLINKFILFFCLIIIYTSVNKLIAQTNPDDYWLNHGFTSGQTVITNTGYFYDAGGNNNYSTGENWNVRFCSENGNPITVDFSGFATWYAGPFPSPPAGAYLGYDYMTINYSGASYVAYHDDTPQFGFTSPSGCINFGFRSQDSSLTHTGWVAEISANPPPPNNDPCDAVELTVGNVCSPVFYNNKGAYDTRGLGSPPCHTFFGGDVWFKATVPSSGQLKIETFAGTLDWAVMVLYSGSDCNTLNYISCDETTTFMPTRILTGRTPGETIYIRIFGDQAKSGTFGICATDPTAPITGFIGPGGVGDKTTNDLWLRADKDVLNNSDNPASNGEAVKTWTDQSGNNNDVTQATAGNQSIFTTAVINGYPVLRLDGTDDYMSTELGNLSAPVTIMAVTKFDQTQDAYVLTLGDLNINNTASISRWTDDKYYCFTGSARYGPVLNNNQPYLLHAAHKISVPYHNLYVDETAATVTDYGSSLITDGSFILGASRTIGSFLDGDVGEVIIYNQILNQAQKIIVENYLAAKYGITLLTTDRYAWKSTHRYDVAGIGQVDASNMHTKAQSARILSIGGAADLEDDEFLLFGHDNGSIGSWTGTERPNGDIRIQRIEREWKTDITGGNGVGPVNISIKDSLLPALPSGFISFNLWIDSDGDFSSDAVAYPVVEIGNEYVANSVTLNDGDYITMGVVQPLVSFATDSSSDWESVSNPQIEVLLNYAVSSEVSVDYTVITGTASQGVDYSLLDNTLKFNPGEKSGYIVPLIIDDTIVEIPDEFFTIKIYNPSAGLLPDIDTLHTYTILNDDILVTAHTDADTIGSCIGSVANLSIDVLGTGPYSYSWTPTTGLSDPAISNPVANPSATTWYKITVTDLSTTIQASDSVLITVIPLPSKPSVTPDGPTVFCEGDSVKLSSSAGYTYLWSTGSNDQDIIVKSSGAYTVQVFDEYGCGSPLSDPLNVTVNSLPAKPTITADGPTTFCEGDSVKLTSDAADSYLWSNGKTTQENTVKTAGDYSVAVTSASGCSSPPSDITTVTVIPLPAKPTISAYGPTTFCEGDSVKLTSSAADSYLWSNSKTLKNIIVKTEGSYNVRIQDVNGCYSLPSDDIQVTVHSLPDKPVITGDSEYCQGDLATLSTITTSYGYIWSNGDTTEQINVSVGSYTVIIRNENNCYSLQSDPFTVSENPLPAKPSISGPTTYCEGANTTITCSAGLNYLWSTGATTQNIEVIEGSYAVHVIDGNNCISPGSDTIIITELPAPDQPTITADRPTTFWQGDSVNLTCSPAVSYIWSPNGETTETITVKTSGSYSVIVGDANGCLSPGSNPVTVTVQILNKPEITVTGSLSFCDGDSVILSATEATGYLWSNGNTNRNITIKQSGIYSVIIYDDIGNASSESDPVEIIVYPNPYLLVLILNHVTCSGYHDGTINLQPGGGTPPYEVKWLNGMTSLTNITDLGPGTYEIIVTDSKGCTVTHSVTITEPEAIEISLETIDPYCPDSYDGSITSTVTGGTPPYSLLWSTGDHDFSISGLSAGNYSLTVTDENLCTSEISSTLHNQQEFCVTVPDIITPNNDGFNDLWEIEGIQYYPDAIVDVYDRWGKRVFHSVGYEERWDGIFNSKELPMDSYHYVIRLNNLLDPIIGNITIVR